MSNMDTMQAFRGVMGGCKEVFLKKTADYGSSWRVMRLPSLTDQIFIKARRLRAIEDKKVQRVADSIESEYVGIINYCLMAMLLLKKPAWRLTEGEALDLSADDLSAGYDEAVEEVRRLLEAKNHDYGEAWRDMRISSYTDLMLAKLVRIKQIEDNAGRTQVSEGVENNYIDIINYAVFALIRLHEGAAY